MQHSISGTSEEFWGFSDLHSPLLLSEESLNLVLFLQRQSYQHQHNSPRISQSHAAKESKISLCFQEWSKVVAFIPPPAQCVTSIQGITVPCHGTMLPVCVCVALCLLLHSGSCGDNRVDNGIIITRAPILGGTIGNVCFDIGTHCTLGLSLNMHFFKFCI